MRSNKYGTQQAIIGVSHYLQNLPLPKSKAADITFLALSNAPDSLVPNSDGLMVLLHYQPIMMICSKGDEITKVFVLSGFYYDMGGNPTKTTRERLNGLLDYLGDEEVIPQGVRVIYDVEHDLCYLKYKEERFVLNKDYTDAIGIDATPDQFSVIQFPDHKVEKERRKAWKKSELLEMILSEDGYKLPERVGENVDYTR